MPASWQAGCTYIRSKVRRAARTPLAAQFCPTPPATASASDPVSARSRSAKWIITRSSAACTDAAKFAYAMISRPLPSAKGYVSRCQHACIWSRRDSRIRLPVGVTMSSVQLRPVRPDPQRHRLRRLPVRGQAHELALVVAAVHLQPGELGGRLVEVAEREGRREGRELHQPVGLPPPERGGLAVALAVGDQDRALVEAGAPEGARGVREVVLDADHRGQRRQPGEAAGQHVLHSPADVVGREVGEGVVVPPHRDHVDVGGRPSGGLQAGEDRLGRQLELRPLGAADALVLDRDEQPAVLDQRRGRVVVAVVEAQDQHRSTSFRVSAGRCGPSAYGLRRVCQYAAFGSARSIPAAVQRPSLSITRTDPSKAAPRSASAAATKPSKTSGGS